MKNLATAKYTEGSVYKRRAIFRLFVRLIKKKGGAGQKLLFEELGAALANRLILIAK